MKIDRFFSETDLTAIREATTAAEMKTGGGKTRRYLHDEEEAKPLRPVQLDVEDLSRKERCEGAVGPSESGDRYGPSQRVGQDSCHPIAKSVIVHIDGDRMLSRARGFEPRSDSLARSGGGLDDAEGAAEEG